MAPGGLVRPAVLGQRGESIEMRGSLLSDKDQGGVTPWSDSLHTLYQNGDVLGMEPAWETLLMKFSDLGNRFP